MREGVNRMPNVLKIIMGIVLILIGAALLSITVHQDQFKTFALRLLGVGFMAAGAFVGFSKSSTGEIKTVRWLESIKLHSVFVLVLIASLVTMSWFMYQRSSEYVFIGNYETAHHFPLLMAIIVLVNFVVLWWKKQLGQHSLSYLFVILFAATSLITYLYTSPQYTYEQASELLTSTYDVTPMDAEMQTYHDPVAITKDTYFYRVQESDVMYIVDPYTGDIEKLE